MAMSKYITTVDETQNIEKFQESISIKKLALICLKYLYPSNIYITYIPKIN